MRHTSDLTVYFKHLPMIVKKVLDEYSKNILVNKIQIYKEYLINHKDTKRIKFNKNNWYQRPHMFCFDNYGEQYQYLHPVILTVNTIKSIQEFIPDNLKDQIILMPSIQTLISILEKK